MELHPKEPNRMHKLPDGNTGTDVVYQTKNIHIQDNLFFFQILHNRLKHLGIVFLIQAQDDVADIYEIVDFFFYGLIFHLYTIKI